MRTFEHFPEQSKCPICDTNKDKESILISLAGTGDGKISEALHFHVDCVKGSLNNEIKLKMFMKDEGLLVIKLIGKLK